MALLETIKNEIKQAGGRMTLAHMIIEESTGWFNIEDRRFFKRRAYLAEAERRKLLKRQKSEAGWKPEDIEFLMDKYGKMPVARLARLLGRTRAATQRKFYKSASKATIEALPEFINGRGYK